MEPLETLKSELKTANSLAMKAKLDLHDLSEELPLGWEKIEEVARKATEAYARAAELKERIAALG